ncbi:MAG: glycerol-3-phosphate acyltransferase [Chloroflexi bacterium]|nr:glycerol-3-phosphate acyltransferase [Chloroflexota bacterium]
MFGGTLAVISAYLLGSIPMAYLVTRLITKKDIRQLGSGNVGANNVFHQVGKMAGITVGVFDVAKGAIAVILASQLFDARLLYLFAAGLAVVLGHMWSIFLRFTGGNGLATSLGVFSILMTREVAIAFALAALFFVLTRNVIFSINVSLLSIPVSAWLLESPRLEMLFVVFSVVLLLVMMLHFWPVAKADFDRAGSWQKFFAELLRQDQTKRNTG